MVNERMLKTRLQEEMRAIVTRIVNKEPSTWIKEFKTVWEEVGMYWKWCKIQM